MLEQITKSVTVLLVGCAILTGCSQFTQAGRQQAAYRRYVKKYSHNRVKQQAKFKKVKVPAGQVSQSNISAGVSGPQSVTSAQ